MTLNQQRFFNQLGVFGGIYSGLRFVGRAQPQDTAGSSNACSTGRRVPSPRLAGRSGRHTLNEITPVKTMSDREGQVADANSGDVRSMKLISVVLA